MRAPRAHRVGARTRRAHRDVCSGAHTGGQTFAAFDGAKMVGFTLAVVGTRAGKAFLHSHQTAVLSEYRDRGVGRQLKLFSEKTRCDGESTLSNGHSTRSN